ncbi:MAG: ABC transporter permease [Acidimicrobiales bacterium]
MTALVQAEIRKLRTIRVAIVLLGALVALVGLSVVGTIATAGSEEGTFSLDTTEGVRNVFGAGFSGAVLVLVLGILGIGSEFRHGTITPVFLVTPRRHRVVTAKLVAYFATGLAFGTVGIVVTLLIAVPWLAAKDVSYSLGSDVLAVFAGSLLATALYGVLGVGVGALIRNQAAAITVAVVWTFVVEGILVGFLPEVGRWVPGGAATALAGGSSTGGDLLPPWAGGLLLAAYGIGLAALGARFVVRRDIT